MIWYYISYHQDVELTNAPSCLRWKKTPPEMHLQYLFFKTSWSCNTLPVLWKQGASLDLIQRQLPKSSKITDKSLPSLIPTPCFRHSPAYSAPIVHLLLARRYSAPGKKQNPRSVVDVSERKVWWSCEARKVLEIGLGIQIVYILKTNNNMFIFTCMGVSN